MLLVLLEVLQLFLLMILVNENHPMKQTWVKKSNPWCPVLFVSFIPSKEIVFEILNVEILGI